MFLTEDKYIYSINENRQPQEEMPSTQCCSRWREGWVRELRRRNAHTQSCSLILSLASLQILRTTAWQQQKQHGKCHSFSPSSWYASSGNKFTRCVCFRSHC